MGWVTREMEIVENQEWAKHKNWRKFRIAQK